MRLTLSNSFLAWGIGIFFFASANCAADEEYIYLQAPIITYISEDRFGLYMSESDDAESILESRMYGEIRYIRTETYENYGLYNDNFGIFFNENGQLMQYSLELSIPHSAKQEAVWITSVDVSSALVERDKTYLWDSKTRTFLDNPWVEGVEGDGAGETISSISGYTDFTYFIFVNGFVSVRNPDLYWYNNRIKELDIVYPSGDRQRVLLEDTMLPQLVVLDKELREISHEIISTEGIVYSIEIVSTYPGSRWDDTCLAAIFAGSTSFD